MADDLLPRAAAVQEMVTAWRLMRDWRQKGPAPPFSALWGGSKRATKEQRKTGEIKNFGSHDRGLSLLCLQNIRIVFSSLDLKRVISRATTNMPFSRVAFLGFIGSTDPQDDGTARRVAGPDR
jgi:hypothetical protein